MKAAASAERIFTRGSLPDLVFRGPSACAWLVFDDLCSVDGWTFLTALAQAHGDREVWTIGCDLDEPTLIPLDVKAEPLEYQRVCDDEFIGANVVRWWGVSGAWGVEGSRGIEVAVAGQRATRDWPRSETCKLLSIDAALRLAKLEPAAATRFLATYDTLSWDPASEATDERARVVALCDGMLEDRVDPIVVIRALVELVEYLPKEVRRIDATARLHKAWTRTHYLLLGEARQKWGTGLLEQNDRNHKQHADEERALVRDACVELKRALEYFVAKE